MFILLIDVLVSMYDKMVEMKKGVVLFYEMLKVLNIKYEILLFSEDVFDLDDHV